MGQLPHTRLMALRLVFNCTPSDGKAFIFNVCFERLVLDGYHSVSV